MVRNWDSFGILGITLRMQYHDAKIDSSVKTEISLSHKVNELCFGHDRQVPKTAISGKCPKCTILLTQADSLTFA